MVTSGCLQEVRRGGFRIVGNLHTDGRVLWLHRLGHLVGRRHPVGECVMDLVDDRDPIVGQTFGDIHLPQRAPTIQRGAHDVADQLIQFATPTGSGHLYVAKVVVQIDIVVLHPHRVMQLQRNVHKLVAKRRQGEQPRVRHLAEQFEGESALHAGHVKHADLQGVHVNFGRLAVQHQRVHAVESPHVPPRSSAPILCPPLNSV